MITGINCQYCTENLAQVLGCDGPGLDPEAAAFPWLLVLLALLWLLQSSRLSLRLG